MSESEDQFPTPVSEDIQMLTLDEDDPTERGRILPAGAVAHDGVTVLRDSPPADRHRALARRLIRNLE